MPFATPLALLGLLFLPVVVAMYLLKLRRDETVVPSTLLWKRLVADVEANAPWQRLRRSLLFLLQLLLVAVLAILAARPFLERPAGLAGDIVLVIDTSASMGATDVSPNRLAAAKDAAKAALRDLPAGGRVSVIAAGATARMVANETRDLGRVRQAIDSIELTSAAGDLGDALALAGALAARSGDAEILVATDASIARPPQIRVEAPIRVLPVGRDRKNQAIVALAVRTAPSGVTRSVFVSVANLDLTLASRRLQLFADGNPAPFEVRDVTVEAQSRSNVVIDEIPRDVRVLEVRLASVEDGATSNPDQLAIDDRAWAVVPPDTLRRVLLVSDGDPYLETALTYLPNTELYGVTPEDYGPATKPELFDLIIFEGYLPADLPSTAVLAIAPPRTSELGVVTGSLREPGIGAIDPNEPILRYVDLSTTHIATAKRLELPEWARTIIPGPGSAPLLYAGERAGVRSAVLAFEPRQSDLPLQVAFPILLANLGGELMGGSGGPIDAAPPGTPVTLPVPDGATGMTITRPDGTSVDVAPGTLGGSTVTFSQTDQTGIYTAVPILVPDSSSGPSASASPSATPSPSPTASGSGVPSDSASARPSPPPVDPGEPIRFAIDLFDVDESNIAPGSPAAIAALGSGGPPPSPGASAGPSASPDASAAPGGGSTAGGERRPARDELWVPIVLLVLAVLMVEYAVYQRDAIIRIWRATTGRLRGGTGSA
jgi:Ca-activated chloride channel family protein